MMYEELVKSLRICAEGEHCDKCGKWEVKENGGRNACEEAICTDAADVIEELLQEVDALKHDIERYIQINTDLLNEPPTMTYEELLRAAKKMHIWIFLHSYDEQEAYDECGLSDEMNAALGYGGQFEIKVNDDV